MGLQCADAVHRSVPRLGGTCRCAAVNVAMDVALEMRRYEVKWGRRQAACSFKEVRRG